MLEHYLTISLALIWVAMTLVYLFAAGKRDNSIVDVFYGLIFVVVAWTLPYVFDEIHPIQATITFFITLWGLRLSARILLKKMNKPEDFRYAKWRSDWSKRGKLYFAVRSYFQIFMLQGLVIYVLLLPLLLVASQGGYVETPILYFGIVVWTLGFLFEIVSDYELDTFTKNPKNKGKVLSTGLFLYSRRPNYFGEAVMWWGVAFVAASALNTSSAILAFLSPILITHILYSVTGPMLEEKWKSSKAYQAYAKKTNYFLPGYPSEK